VLPETTPKSGAAKSATDIDAMASKLLPPGLGIFRTGCCISDLQACISILSASFYPTYCRATGVSWASDVGRNGSILGSALCGVMLSRE
jgi:AAHS family 4-hydroxybenzoate transporter-like MFS transporter